MKKRPSDQSELKEDIMGDEVKYKPSRYNHFVENGEGRFLARNLYIQKPTEKARDLGIEKKVM